MEYLTFDADDWVARRSGGALRISRTVFSALSGMRLLACLIVAPQRGYDEPAISMPNALAVCRFCERIAQRA